MSTGACPSPDRTGEASDGRGNMWGSFDYGMAHFVSISTETDFYQYVL